MKKSVKIIICAGIAVVGFIIGILVGNIRPTTHVESGITKASCPFPVEVFSTSNGKIDVYCVSHGSLVIDFISTVSKDSRTIYIDPVGDDDQVNYRSLPKADAVLITHDHGDHLHIPTIDAYSKKDAQYFVNQSAYDKLGYGTVMNNGDKAKISSAITVKAVPAYNTTPDHKDFHPKGVGNGYLLKIDGFVIYIAGDTEPYAKMRSLGDVDLAFLPVNQPYTMTIKQCVKAAKYVDAKITIPYHLSDTDLNELDKALGDAGIEHIIQPSLR